MPMRVMIISITLPLLCWMERIAADGPTLSAIVASKVIGDPMMMVGVSALASVTVGLVISIMENVDGEELLVFPEVSLLITMKE